MKKKDFDSLRPEAFSSTYATMTQKANRVGPEAGVVAELAPAL
jgi:hypothetical protein